MIDLDGSLAGPAHGLWVVSSQNQIEGLVIRNFQQSGVRIQGMPTPTAQNMVTLCFIGTDPTGTVAQGNGWNQLGLWGGVEIVVPPGAPGFAHDNMVDSSLLAANYAEGVSISNCPPGDVFMNHVVHNLIGTDVSGMLDLGNQHCGVYIGEGAHDNFVVDNVISGNDFQGVSIVGYAEATPPVYTNSNHLDINAIGVAVDRVTPLPNTMDGVAIGLYGTTWYRGGYAEDNEVLGNLIAHNGRHGVVVWEHWSSPWNADRNGIVSNSIHSNALLGIDLDDDMVTPNDPGDPDSGANECLNMPVVTSAVWSAAGTTITGTVDVPAPTTSMVEVFRAAPDPTGFGEGQTLLGATTPDAAGSWSLVVTGLLVVGDPVTATIVGPLRDTSEFAACVAVTASTAVGDETAPEASPPAVRLAGARPSPFAASTSIGYELPVAGHVRLAIYDITGRQVRVLIDATQEASAHAVTWDGTDAAGRAVARGVYLARLEAAGQAVTRKLMVE
jgi:hypothetical protein